MSLRQLGFADGLSSSTAPSSGDVQATNLLTFANDAAFVTAKGSPAQSGDLYVNSTDDTIHFFTDAWFNSGGGGGGGSPPSVIHLHGGNGHGSTNVVTRRYTSVRTNVGSDLTLTQDATNGDDITIDTTGRYLIIVYDRSSTSAGFIGASRNDVSAQIQLIPIANQLCIDQVSANVVGSASGFYDLVATDKVRGHDDGNANETSTVFVKLIVAGPF